MTRVSLHIYLNTNWSKWLWNISKHVKIFRRFRLNVKQENQNKRSIWNVHTFPLIQSLYYISTASVGVHRMYVMFSLERITINWIQLLMGSICIHSIHRGSCCCECRCRCCCYYCWCCCCCSYHHHHHHIYSSTDTAQHSKSTLILGKRLHCTCCLTMSVHSTQSVSYLIPS